MYDKLRKLIKKKLRGALLWQKWGKNGQDLKREGRHEGMGQYLSIHF